MPYLAVLRIFQKFLDAHPEVDDFHNVTVSSKVTFLVKIFTKMRSVVLSEVANKQTDRQTNKRANAG